MSLSSLFSIARSALLAHQRAMTVTAHNVANAQTPGYSRQRLSLVSLTSNAGGRGTSGLGVGDTGVLRTRDRFLDAAYRRQMGLLGGSGTLRGMLSQIEASLMEPSDDGIAAALDGMFQSFGDLATDPSSSLKRDLVRAAADKLTQKLRQLDAQIGYVMQDTTARLRAEVAEVNSLAEQIAALNREILASQNSGGASPDLEDQRDLLLDQLAGYGTVEVVPKNDGTVAVSFGDAVLVDGSSNRKLAVTEIADGGVRIAYASGGGAIDPRSGSLKALAELATQTLPAYKGQLDRFASTLVAEVNAIHRTGHTPGNKTNTDFFDPEGLTAGTIRLAPDVAASGEAIAASSSPDLGNNDVALAIAALANQGLEALQGMTLRAYFSNYAVSVGTDVADATQDETAFAILADQADAARMSVSGVSVDEEMVNLIGQQEAYAAAARIIQVADEMIQDLLRLI